jgi:hypothetical protein
MDDERIAINPVLRDFETTLADAATAPESDLDTDRERTITTRTDNQLAAAAAQAALGDLGTTVERATDDIQIDVQTDGVTETLAGLRTVRDRLADLDDEDARVSVTLDVDRSALDRLSDLDLNLADDTVSRDVDTDGERTVGIDVDIDTDMNTDVNRTLRRAAGGLGGISIPVEFDARQRVRDLLPDSLSRSISTEIDETISGSVGTVGDSEDRTIRIGYDTDETRVLEDLATIHAELAALPDRKDININTEAELAALVRSIDGLESLPDHVRSEVDVEAHSTAAQGELSAVLAQAQTLDQIDPSVDVDSDGSALDTLRSRDAFGLDFDAPDLDMPGGGRDRNSLLSEGAGGFRQLMGGLARGVPGLRGAASALGGGMGPAAVTGAGAGVGGLLSMGVGAGAGLAGGGIAGGGLLGSLALGVKLNTSDREIAQTKAHVQAALSTIEGNADFEFISESLRSDAVEATSLVAAELNSISGDLRGTFTQIETGAMEQLPSIIGSVSNSITTLGPTVASISTGIFETLPGFIDESTRAASEFLPVLQSWAKPLGPIIGSMSRLGTALFSVLEAPVNAILTPLAEMAPLTDLVADGFSIVGQALSFATDNIGLPLWDKLGGTISWAAGWVRYFGEGLYNLADRFGIVDAVAGAFETVGSVINSLSADSVASFANGIINTTEGMVNRAIRLYNRANNSILVPGDDLNQINVGELSGEDLMAPGSGGSDGSGTPPGIPSTESAGLTASAIASLPSQGTDSAGTSTSAAAAGPSSLSSPVSSPATGTTATPAAAGKTVNNKTVVNNNQTINVTIEDADGNGRQNGLRTARAIRDYNTRKAKQYGAASPN